MHDLWHERRKQAARSVEPLAQRLRPRTLDEFAGQGHILGPGKLLRRMLAADALSSLILHGPPGTGKTTLAQVIAHHTQRHFESENAAAVGVARIRQIIDQASERLADSGKRTVLFLDEIHRFTRAQQDVLLGDVERGLITLIGATTENPLFAINSALISRSTLLRFEPLSEADIVALLKRAINDRERGFGALSIQADDDALALWAKKSDGDARRALTALEVAVRSSIPLPEGGAGGGLDREVSGVLPSGVASADNQSSAAIQLNPIHLTLDIAEQSIQQKAAVYADDQHYDSASALIKSIRGSDPDAALYWCAHMLEGGEDPRFIARRLAILASEDIGNADPRAIMVAQAAWELVERIGLPEARITLAQCITYLALAPKSNASYMAIESAIKDVKEGRTIPVPIHIKDKMVRKAGTKSAGTAGGDSYKYAHEQGQRSNELGMIGTQDYLGVDKRYYHPTDHGTEAMLKQRLEEALRARGKQP